MIALLKRSKPHKKPADAARNDDVEIESKYGKLDLKMARRMGRSLLPFKWYYALGLGLALPQNLLEMQGPQFMKYLINYTTDRATYPNPTVHHVGWIMLGWAGVLIAAVILQRMVI